jgi:hypothetical protein
LERFSHSTASPRFFARRVSKVGPLASVGSMTVAARSDQPRIVSSCTEPMV